MRLIDAEKLIKAIEDFPNTENGYSDTYDKEYIISEIDVQPTVDAIPVEWLKKEMCEMYRLESVAKNEETKRLCHNEAVVIERLIDDWREANGTAD